MNISERTNLAWSRYWSTRLQDEQLSEGHRQCWKVLNTEKEQQAVDFFRARRDLEREQWRVLCHECTSTYEQTSPKPLICGVCGSHQITVI